MSQNPWLRTQSENTVKPVEEHFLPRVKMWTHPGNISKPVRVVIASAHAGAGASALASATGFHEVGLGWNEIEDTDAVLVVARGYASGLNALSSFGRAWSENEVGGHLLGALVNADHPRDLKELKQHREFIAGGFPSFWFMPYVDAWRLSSGSLEKMPKQGLKIVRELHALEENIVKEKEVE